MHEEFLDYQRQLSDPTVQRIPIIMTDAHVSRRRPFHILYLPGEHEGIRSLTFYKLIEALRVRGYHSCLIVCRRGILKADILTYERTEVPKWHEQQHPSSDSTREASSGRA